MKLVILSILALLTSCSTTEKRGDTGLFYKDIRAVERAIWHSDLTCHMAPIKHLRKCPLGVDLPTAGKCIDAYVTRPSEPAGHYFRVVLKENEAPTVLEFRQAGFKAMMFPAEAVLDPTYDLENAGEIKEFPDSGAGFFTHGCPYERRSSWTKQQSGNVPNNSFKPKPLRGSA